MADAAVHCELATFELHLVHFHWLSCRYSYSVIKVGLYDALRVDKVQKNLLLYEISRRVEAVSKGVHRLSLAKGLKDPSNDLKRQSRKLD